MKEESFRKVFLILLLVLITAYFVAMIRQFLLTILVAAIFSGLVNPFYERLQRWFRGHRNLAAACTLLAVLVLVVAPLLSVLGIVVSEAISVTQMARPWIEERIAQPGLLAEHLPAMPWLTKLEPYRTQIYEKLGAAVGSVGGFLVQSLSATTRGTVAFFFHLSLMLYSMFFFLLDGKKFLARFLYLLPLDDKDERRMVEKFVSVTRATVKGTLVIGIVQGTLAGMAFAVVGIKGAVFWGTLMTVLSIIPGIGTALVWVPAVIILVATGRPIAGILLAIWCALVVGSADNVLRPRLVGRDTEMHDLLIFVATLGGILLFGALGFILGPILAALFVTIWDIYAVVFRDALPRVSWLGPDDDGC